MWPWEWDWKWGWFALFCLGCFVFGLINRLIGVPGIFPALVGSVVGAVAGSWDWFEAHEGNNDY